MSIRSSAPASDTQGTIYLIHLNRAYRHARHYLGWTLDIERRLATHRQGHGSPLLRAATAAGITFDVVRTWPGDRHLERRLHNAKNSPARLCPICRGHTSASLASATADETRSARG